MSIIKKAIAFLGIFLISFNCFALVSSITEEDGSPDTYPWRVKFANGALTDNSDGTVSVAAGAGLSVPTSTRCAILPELAAADDNIPLGSFTDAVTITSVWCTCSGTCSTMAQMSLEDGAGNAMSHTAPTCTAIGSVPTAQSVTSGGGLTARESLRVDVDNAPVPETDTYELCVSYT